jgi:hypothetical protein
MAPSKKTKTITGAVTANNYGERALISITSGKRESTFTLREPRHPSKRRCPACRDQSQRQLNTNRVGISCAFPFAVLLAVCAALHVAATKFGWADVQEVGGRKRIPLAPSVAAAMILCFLLGCLQPIERVSPCPYCWPW